MRYVFFILSLLLSLTPGIAIGCGDDDAVRADVASDSAAVVPDGAADVAETSSAACPFSGTWNLQNVLCGDNDITADWFRTIDRTTIVFSASGAGCGAQTTNETDACKEEERGTFTGAGDSWNVVSQGITACTPAACTFGGQDAACKVGDRATSYAATISLAAGKLSFTTSVGICASAGAGTPTTFIFEQR